ncbi:carbonic anhydrase [Pontimonas sp.]|uniref:beta-class carbonic anhydrase n=1 Tax=Pontimonas sp. TaxID=2304492 RepID=UPI0028705A7F|nr:carbonic anhydrase [Pontimonas sp.]MDR9397343.1 carbonic anhydrase [Pontimonas sp.]
MSFVDEAVANNRIYAESFVGPLPLPPAKKLAVLACMDARLDVARVLGLNEGDAHVIRNAGGVVTEAEIRSLAISQHLLDTKEIILIHHTDCGMLTFNDGAFLESLASATGIRPSWAPMAFTNPEEDVRSGIRAIKQSPFVPHTAAIRGFIFDVETGLLNEVQNNE